MTKAGVLRPVRLVLQASPGLNRYAFSLTVPFAMRWWTAIFACTVFLRLRISSSRRNTWLKSSSLTTDATSICFTSLPVRLERRQPVDEVVRVAVGGAVAQGEERIERRERRDAALALHVLRLVQDQHRPGRLDQVDRRRPLQPVGALADDVVVLVEGVDRHDQDSTQSLWANCRTLAMLLRVVDREAVGHVVVQARRWSWVIFSVLSTPSRTATDGTTTMNFRRP